MESLWPYKGSLPSQQIQALLHTYRMGGWDNERDLYWDLIELVKAAVDQVHGERQLLELPVDGLHGPIEPEPILK